MSDSDETFAAALAECVKQDAEIKKSNFEKTIRNYPVRLGLIPAVRYEFLGFRCRFRMFPFRELPLSCNIGKFPPEWYNCPFTRRIHSKTRSITI